MIVIFWNVQRLGSKTPDSKNEIMEQVLAEAFGLHGAEAALLCEVTSGTQIGEATISKQVCVRKRGAKGSSAQLGYAAIDEELKESVLEAYYPPSYKDVFDSSPWKKGGGEFRKQSKRFVASVGDVNGIHLYVYHANASTKASFLVGWLAEALHQEHDGKFVLTGDLNCEPAALIEAMKESGSDLQQFNVAFGGHTHNAKKGLSKTYDYAVSGNGVALNVTVLNIGGAIAHYSKSVSPSDDMSDHCPILVQF